MINVILVRAPSRDDGTVNADEEYAGMTDEPEVVILSDEEEPTRSVPKKPKALGGD
jgi:hypothetical protein